jgi:hypothetical protein
MKKSFCLTSLLVVFIVLGALITGCGGNSGGPTTMVYGPMPLIWYTFDSSGTDSSGHGYNATLSSGATINTSAKVVGSGCLDLTANDGTISGKTAYVTLPTFTLSGTFTVACWVKLTSYGTGWPRLFNFYGSTNGVVFIPTDQSYIDFIQETGGNGVWPAFGPGWGNMANASNYFPLNTWVHMIFVYDNSASSTPIDLYINGSAISIYDNWVAKTPQGTLTNNVIGHSDAGGDSDIKGYVDDFRVYNTALTSSQITALYQGKLSTE